MKLDMNMVLNLEKVDAQNPVDSVIVAVGHNEFRSLSAVTCIPSYMNCEKPVFS